MVADRQLPGAGYKLVSGSGILQLVEQTGGVGGERMVLCACARRQGVAGVGGEQRGSDGFAVGSIANGLRPLSWTNRPGIHSGDEAGGELSKTQRLSSACGNGDGICDTSGVGDIPI